MTKKRYIWGNNYGDLLKDTQNNTLLTMKDCLNRLNKQEDKIKKLEEYINEYCEYGCETCILNDHCEYGVLRYD